MSRRSALRVATAQYPVEQLSSWAQFRDKLASWVAEAADAGAELLLFPEYFSLELASLFGEEVCRSLPLQLERLQKPLGDFLALFRALAHDRGVHICAGSYPVAVADAHYCNRSYFFWPNGHCDFQEKLQMTRFERERWGVAGGRGLKVFATDLGRVAIAICYDAEFPLLVRHQVEQGAELVLVPSCTDTLAGYHRVRIGCQARALENQCYVVQSPTVGECPWSEAIDVNVGAAAVYTPSDGDFPADGVLAAGVLNAPQWVYADLDLPRMAAVRREGQVLNHRDWPAQLAHLD